MKYDIAKIREECLANYDNMLPGQGFCCVSLVLKEAGVFGLFDAIPEPPFAHAVLLDLKTANVVICRLEDGQDPFLLLAVPSMCAKESKTKFDAVVIE